MCRRHFRFLPLPYNRMQILNIKFIVTYPKTESTDWVLFSTSTQIFVQSRKLGSYRLISVVIHIRFNPLRTEFLLNNI
jgi:hypothetical protein